jgi:hypothetical protein
MGLDAVALTEHFDNPDFKRIYIILDLKFSYVGPYYVAKGVKVFPGVEVSINKGPHLLAISDCDSVLKYFERIPKKSNRKPRCSAKAFFEYQNDLNILSIFAHPFRPGREAGRIAKKMYSCFDAMSLNARDVYFYGMKLRKQTRKFALDWDYLWLHEVTPIITTNWEA